MKNRRHIRVYPAGAIQGVNLLDSLANIERGNMWTAKLFQLGFSVFPVFSDYVFIQKVRPVPAIQDVYDYSLSWLRVADAMYCIEGWETSKGCANEIKEAQRCGVQIFYDITDLCAWADRQNINPMSDAEKIIAESDD